MINNSNKCIFFFLLTTQLLSGQQDKISETSRLDAIESSQTRKVGCIAFDSIDGMAIFSFAEKMPEFKEVENNSAIQYLSKNIKYPALNTTEEIQFKISVSFVVDTAGKVRNPCILNPKYEDKYTETEKAILKGFEMMPDWNPGMHNGKKVPIRFYVPINIKWSHR